MADLEQSPVAENSPATESVAPETPQTIFDMGADETSTDQVEETDPDLEEELDGVKVRGKAAALEKLKAERLMQADYTRKTQEVAEQRRAIEAAAQAIARQQQVSQAHIREVAQLVAIEDRLKQFAQVNWQALSDSDPVQAQKLHIEMTQLQTRRGQVAASISQREQQRTEEAQRITAKRLQEASDVLSREIKGWSPEYAGKLLEYGVANGGNREALAQVTDPFIVKVLHKAHLYDQLQKQQAAKPADPAPPVTRVGGSNAGAVKRLSQMTDAEFIASRRKYIANHR